MEFKKIKYKEKEIEITFKNDAIFKGLFCENDSLPFLKFFINSFTGKNFHSFKLQRNEVDGNQYNGKVFYFDVLAKDEYGRDVIIEMQNSIIGKVHEIRFQVYASRVVSNKVYKGMDYSEVTSVDVIIVSSEKYRNKLYSKATLRFEDGEEVNGNLTTYHIISLPYVNKTIDNKLEVSDRELLAYIFQNGIDDDIIRLATKSQKEMIQYMEKSYVRMLNDNPYFTVAELQAIKAWEDNALEKEKELRIKQIEQQRNEAEQQRYEAEQQRIEAEQQRIEAEQQRIEAVQKLKEANEMIAKLQQQLKEKQ